MKYNEAFPTDYYKAADLPSEGLVLTVASVSTEAMPEGKERRCLSFQEGTKKLTLNRTNWAKLAELTKQDDDSSWPGHRIRLVKQRVLFKGDMVDAIRISTPDVPF